MTFKLSKLPKPIRVGAHEIQFAYLSDDDAKIDFGNFYSGDMQISLAKEYAAGSVAVDTAIHEVCHAILCGAGIKDDAQEHVCTIVGHGFTQVLRDNPEFVRWMLKTVGK